MPSENTESVVITGANSGIGRATALRMAAEGYRVFAAMRDTGKAEKLLALAADAGSEIQTVELDVTDADSVKRACVAIFAQTDAVDVLVNNAGIAFNATVEDIDIEAAKVVFETNFWGVIRCTQSFLPQMRKRGRGHIINISSVTGRIAALAQPVYSSSKWALEGLSENLAQELAAFGLRVSIIEPGVTRTAILPKNVGYPKPTAYEAAYRRMLQFYARGIEANVSADEVAETILAAHRDPDPKLRYTCGWGGEELTRGREAISDEQWIALGKFESDEDYYDAFEQVFGLALK